MCSRYEGARGIASPPSTEYVAFRQLRAPGRTRIYRFRLRSAMLLSTAVCTSPAAPSRFHSAPVSPTTEDPPAGAHPNPSPPTKPPTQPTQKRSPQQKSDPSPAILPIPIIPKITVQTTVRALQCQRRPCHPENPQNPANPDSDNPAL